MAKDYEVERRVDCVGRVVIPKDMRKTYGLEPNAKITITAKRDGIYIKLSKEKTA